MKFDFRELKRRKARGLFDRISYFRIFVFPKVRFDFMIKRTTERNPYFELLRGVAIIMVVGIHTFKTGSDFSLFVRQILNCAVPLFLACSGFFMAKKDVSDTTKYKTFLSKQIPKVYIPCLVWSIPYLILSLSWGGSIKDGIINLIFCGFSIYYFILLIMQYYALLPYYQKMNKKHLLINAAVSLVSIAIVAYLTQIQQRSIPLVRYAGLFPLWTVFFAYGVYLGKQKQRNYKLYPYVILTLCGLVLSYLESKYYISIGSGGVGIKPSSFLYSFGIIAIAFSSKLENLLQGKTSVERMLNYIGRISFGIYLIHCYFIFIFGATLPNQWNAMPWILKFSFVLLLSIVVIQIFRKLSKKHSAKIGL